MKFNTLEDRMLYFRGLSDYKLMPNSYILVMLDGRSFSKLIKNNFERPFSNKFIDMMNETAKFVCQNVQGCKFGYVQSDEISLVLTDFDTPTTDSFFDYRISKLQSIIASLATSKFNQLMTLDMMSTPCSIDDMKDMICNAKLIQFDCKVWNVPSLNDVYAWFLYRQKDCTRNSIAQTAQTYIPHKDLQHLYPKDMVVKLLEKGIDWNSFDDGKKYGRFIKKEEVEIIKEIKLIRRQWKCQNAFPLEKNKDKFIDYTKLPVLDYEN